MRIAKHEHNKLCPKVTAMALQCFEGLLLQLFARDRPTGHCRSRESSSACVSETMAMTAEGVGLLDVEAVASASLESESGSLTAKLLYP